MSGPAPPSRRERERERERERRERGREREREKERERKYYKAEPFYGTLNLSSRSHASTIIWEIIWDRLFGLMFTNCEHLLLFIYRVSQKFLNPLIISAKWIPIAKVYSMDPT